jgi:hypothetical protein
MAHTVSAAPPLFERRITMSEKKSLKETLFKTVHPVLGYSLFGGAVAIALAIGIIVCLLV